MPHHVGRRYEQSRLVERLDEACGGQPRVVLLSGEPGIGKSTLVGGLLTAARLRGCCVLSGHCVEGLRMPYAPFADSLFPEIRSRLARWRRENASFALIEDYVAPMPTEVDDAARDVDASRARFILSEALLRLCAERPVVLSVDDFHWTDRPTADLLLQSTVRAVDRAEREPVPLLIVATLRGREAVAVGTHIARMRREPCCSTIDLTGLDRLETGELLSALGVGGLTTEAVTRIHHLTRGNPLYVTTLARSLLLRALTAAELDFHGIDLPVEVREVIDVAISSLDDRTTDVLRIGAVIGDTIDLDQLQNASDAPERAIRSAVEAGLDAGLLRTHGGSIEFAHPLYREALRTTLVPWREREIHLAAARALSEQPTGAPIALVATHYAAAGDDAEPHEAIPVLDAAARQAEALYAWDEAVRFLDAALRLRRSSDPDVQVLDFLHRAGLAHLYNGEPGAGLDLIEDARRMADELQLEERSMQLRVDLVHWLTVFRVPDHAPAADGLERQLCALEATDPGTCSRGLAQLAQYRWGGMDFDGGERLAFMALDCATTHEVHDAAEAALRSLAIIDWRYLRLEQAAARLDLAHEEAKACLNRTFQAGPASRLPIVKIWLGDLRGARRGVDIAMTVVRETNYLVEESLPRLALLYLDVIDGELDAALGLAADIYFLERMSGYPWAAGLTRAIVARIRALQGEWTASHEAIDEWEDAGTETPIRQRASQLLRARVLAGEGRREEAVVILEALMPTIDERWRSIGGDAAAATLIETVDALDLDTPLDDAVSLLSSLDQSQTFTTMFLQFIPRVIGDALLHDGRLADARDRLEDATAIAARIGARSELAQCHYSLARLSMLEDRPHDAERYLRTAVQQTTDRQADLASRIRAFARRFGLSLGADHLTDRLVAETVEVVVMFVDIVDSTRLAWEYGDNVFRGLATRLDQRVRIAIDRCGGRAVEGVNVGDGLLAEFESPGDALDCATTCVDLSDEIGLSLHVGLNVGSVIRERGSVFGTTVNVAARVTGQSRPSEILVTEDVMERSARSFARFADKGFVELKGLPEPMRLYSYEPDAAMAI